MSDILSDMKAGAKSKKASAKKEERRVFTVRDLNRQPQVVLKAARKLGSVIIQSRDTGSFTLSPSPTEKPQKVIEAEAFLARQVAYRERLASMGFAPPSTSDAAKLELLLAGESL